MMRNVIDGLLEDVDGFADRELRIFTNINFRTIWDHTLTCTTLLVAETRSHSNVALTLS